MATGKGKSKAERLHAAAVVKMKYLVNTGRLDAGFEFIFQGVLQDLKLTADEVDTYIEEHRDELMKLCVQGE